jgi:guanylate kinase
MFSVSSTTRPPRATESPGKCYDFISEDEFNRRVAAGDFLEYAQVFGRNWYGTPRQTVDEARRTGRDLVLEIDVQGAKQVKEKLPEAIAIFIVPPSRQDLERRLRSRGQDSDEAIARRLERARQEMARSVEYDFVVVNDDLERASNEVLAIAVAARCRRRDNEERLRRILETFGGS